MFPFHKVRLEKQISKSVKMDHHALQQQLFPVIETCRFQLGSQFLPFVVGVQVQMLLEAQKKLQVNTQTSRSTTSVAVETGECFLANCIT